MTSWNDPQGEPHEPVEPNQTNEPTEANEQPQPYRAWGARPEEVAESRYLGLTATQFNLAFFAVIAAVAVAAFVFLGGAGAISGFVGDDEPSRSTATVAEVTPTPTEAPPALTPTPADDSATGSGDGGAAVTSVLNTFDPLSVVGALSSGAAPQLGEPIEGSQADGSLGEALLQQGDLPAGFETFGEMTFSMPVEGTTANMALNMFATGDMEGGDFGTLVMSGVIESADMAALGDLDATELSEGDLAEVGEALSNVGIQVGDLRLLDASGLGEGGFGMHMEMDFSELFAGFQELIPDESMPTAFAWDMYAWAHGDRMYMLMVMWTPGAAGVVDARALADIVDGRADG